MSIIELSDLNHKTDRIVLLDGVVDLQVARVDPPVEANRGRLPCDARHRVFRAEVEHCATERPRHGLQRGDEQELLLLLADHGLAEGLLNRRVVFEFPMDGMTARRGGWVLHRCSRRSRWDGWVLCREG